jgi:hypothetical protein
MACAQFRDATTPSEEFDAWRELKTAVTASVH